MIHDASKLCLLLRDLFPANQYAHITEFRQELDGKDRRLDALAWGYRQRNGFDVIGFETKVSRADLLAELKDPEKWAAAREICDRFYLVVGDASIVKGLDLPEEWGLIIPSWADTTLTIDKMASELQPPLRWRAPVHREVVGAFLDRLLYNPNAEREHVAYKVRQAHEKGHREGFAEGLRLGKKKARKAEGKIA